jgi:signal transduction histidine kinase
MTTPMPDANMLACAKLQAPAMLTESAMPRVLVRQALAQPVAAVVALLICVWGLLDGVWPTWPVWTIIAVLVCALLGTPRARRHGNRLWETVAHPAAAFTALVLVAFALPDGHGSWPLSPLWVVALVLGSGLAIGPLLQLARGRATQECVQPLCALVALLVLIWGLAVDGYWYYTLSPGTLHSSERLPVVAFRIAIVALALTLVATALIRSGTVRRFVGSLATLAALLALLVSLVTPPSHGLSPLWPLSSAVAILGLGLGADLLAWMGSQPQARVLAERVDDLSRTRSGALDAQANELRRIERDLHDGAQVRLIALSLKLGRAEDFYRDDPRTATLLREAREDATAAIRELRELARGIAPPVLANRGLEAAVRSVSQRSGVEVTVTARLGRRLPLAVERAAYFVVAESLANAAKHAAGARVQISLDDHGHDLLVEITDFGPGGADPAGGGLTGLRQRVEALDGVLNVTSPAGVGTQVEAILPCGQ